jgi:hypothetical protein
MPLSTKLPLFTGEIFSFDRQLKLRFGLAGFRDMQQKDVGEIKQS